jgi:hypothetical protein
MIGLEHDPNKGLAVEVFPFEEFELRQKLDPGTRRAVPCWST